MSNTTSQGVPIKSSSSKNKGSADMQTAPTNNKPFTPGLTGHPTLKISNTIEKLKPPGPDSNYLEWSWILNMHFGTTGVEHIINPANPNPKQSPTCG
jgi:hypothetical protein